ncbi:MAG: FtsX-like permease family protein [SAR324 cluster bacterium]|nr:FtsX-like permease family protein [SAR324 cluster bacterium]
MILLAKLALKEIRNNARFSLFFILNLSLGLIGFIALDSFKTSIQHHLENNSKAILTADLSVTSNQPFTQKERQLFSDVISPKTGESRQVRFFSMIAGKNNSRLVRIIGIDDQYPLYGQIVLKNGGTISKGNQEQQIATKQLLSTKSIWVANDLMLALELEDGDTLKIGESPFAVVDTIMDDPTSAISVFAGIPTIYMGVEQIENTGLISLGSRVSYLWFYRLTAEADLEVVVDGLRQRLEKLYPGSPKIRVETHQDASNQLGRVLGYLNDYLGLVALIALFLAGVGAAYLFRSFLVSRFKEMAILISLGATRRDAYQMMLFQIVILGLVSAAIASALAFLILPLLPAVLRDFLPKGFESQMGWSSLLLAFFMGTLGSVICCLPILTRIYHLNPIALFHENIIPAHEDNRSLLRVGMSYVPAMAVYWILAVWQAHSWIVGSLFIALFLGAMLILGTLAWSILTLCGKFSNRQGVTQRIALRNLSRNRLGAISCFLAIGLGALLLNIIPQIQQGLQNEISQPVDVKVPSFFLFDIQPEQVDALRDYLKEEQQHLSYLSPMIRARLEAVNGKTFASNAVEDAITREQETERRFRNRGFNLSYRAQLQDSEAYVAGKPLSARYDITSSELPEISLEKRFAERLGLKIGDELTFDVQSVPIAGKVVNLRKVKWNSFQPNFFITFQPGVLEEAPKTFLAGISNVESVKKISLQNGIVQRFPNISVIDVSLLVGRILTITDQISWAIRVMAYLSILAGLVVLFSIARYEVQQRFWEINLLKVLGARFQDVRAIIQIEFGILGFFAALFGVALSVILSFTISFIVFESIWSFSWVMMIVSIIGISFLSVLTALAATHHVLKQKPLGLLKAT